jgi:uncharacterized membrane protein YpjA
MEVSSVLPRRWAELYLTQAPNLVALLLVNGVALLVGVRFYVAEMVETSTWLWPLFADSPVALFLAICSLVTLLPALGRSLDAVPSNGVLAVLHTLAFVWLVKMGLWTALALGLGFDQYYPAPWDFFGIIATHLAFVGQALLIPYYGKTSRSALGIALALALVNDVLDYGFGLHPPLRYEPGLALPVGTVFLSIAAVGLAAVLFRKRDENSV